MSRHNIPREKIQEILDRVDIERVVGRSVQLKSQGARLVGLCPFHKEKSPSFSVDRQKKLYHCFGCKAGGDVFDFVMRLEHLEFPEAIRQLARETGVEIPERAESEEERRDRSERERLYRINELARAFYERALWDDATALSYLRDDRGLSDATIRAWHLGFAPQSWSALSDALLAKGVSEEQLVRVGLSGRRKEGRGVYDKLRGRVVFPIAIPGGNIAGFGARRADWLVSDESEKGPKYLNSPESPIYEKSNIFYGLAEGRDAIRRARRAILVEGYLDVIALHQAGVEQAIATCGTALSGRHTAILSRLAPEIVTLYDGDAAGLDATWRASELLLAQGLSVRVASLPQGEDPDTFVQKQGGEALTALVEAAPSAIDAAVELALKRHQGAGLAGTIKVVDELRPLIMAVKDPLARDLFLDGAAKRLRVDPRVFRQHLSRQPGRDAPPPPSPERPRPLVRVDPPSKVELALLRHLIEDREATLRALESKDALGAFHHAVTRAVVGASWASWRAGSPFDAGRALEAARELTGADEESLRILRETLLDPLPRANDLEECLENLLRNDKQRSLRGLRERVARETDPEALERLQEEIARVLKR